MFHDIMDYEVKLGNECYPAGHKFIGQIRVMKMPWTRRNPCQFLYAIRAIIRLPHEMSPISNNESSLLYSHSPSLWRPKKRGLIVIPSIDSVISKGVFSYLLSFDLYAHHPRLFDTFDSLERENPRSNAAAQKTYTYQFDVAKMKPIPRVGGITIRIATQSGTGIRYGRCTVDRGDK